MSATIKVNADNLSKMLRGYSKLTGEGVPSLVKRYARIACVNLSARTQPFSVGQKGKGRAYQQGTTRTSHDIEAVVRGRKKLQQIADHMRVDEIRTRMQAYVASGNYNAVGRILENTGVIKGWNRLEMVRGKADTSRTHSRHRSRRTGRTTRKPDALYLATNENQLSAHIKKAQTRVGLSKSGWGACAQKLHAVKGDQQRGIPVWAKAKKGRLRIGRIVDLTRRRRKPHVRMTNKVPWVSRLLPPAARKRALWDAKVKMVKEMKRELNRIKRENAS